MTGEFEHRPWGSWHVLDEGPGYKVKRIEVTPGQRFSYQTHEHRSEQWVVVTGTATCVIDGEDVMVGPNQTVLVQVGQAHRITNMQDELLVIVECKLVPTPARTTSSGWRTTTAGPPSRDS